MIPRPLLTTGKNSLRLALAAGAVGQLLGLPPVLAQEPAAEVQELTPMMVTGSLIPTTDLVGLTPVTSITSVDLVQRGVSTPAEVVRRLPAVVGGNLSESYGNGGDGSSRINLRGIPGGTLVLINGRRVAPVAFADAAVDLNMIPFAAIDRIEVLKDGASAIYGSDAVAGVVNIILKRDFEGVELGAYVGNTTETDTFRQNYSFTAGTTTDKAGFTVAGNYYKQNALYSKDRDRSKVDTSKRDGSYIQQVATSISNPGRFTVPNNLRGDDKLYNPALPPTQNVPVSLNRDVAQTRPNGPYTPDDYHWSMAQIFNPARANEGFPDKEVYPFDKFPFPDWTPAIRPAERYSFFGTGYYQIFDEHVEFFADAFYSHSKSENQLAPTPMTNGSAGFPIPASNYYNPFGRNITTWAYRFVELGPRIDRVEKDAFRIVPGLRGKLPDSETWTWETAFLYSVERGDNYLLGDINRTRLRELSTLSTPDAFNPFGFQANNALVDQVRRDLYIAGETELWSVDGRVGGDVFDLPAGGVGVVVGGGYQEDSGESLPDGNLIAGDLIGFNAADPLVGERSISSVFGEVKIPIFSEQYNIPGAHAFNVRVQARYDYYSDFGDTTNPGVKFGWQPVDEYFQIFGSWSTSFRAPTFSDLYTTAQESFPEVRNPYNGDFAQIETTQRGNPNLEPEEADNWTIGGEWRVKQVPGLKLGLTYFRIERENTPGGSAQFIADQIAAQFPNPAPNTYYFADGTSQTQAPSGAQNNKGWFKTDASDARVIETMNVPTQNLSADKLDGFDIDASYDWQTDTFGTFSFAMAWQYLLNYEQEQIPGQGYIDRLGDYSADEFGYESLPRFKGYGSFFWTYDKFSTGFFANYTSSYLDDKLAGVDRKVDDYLTFDIQASYEFPYNIKLTVGCLNVTDAAPPLVVGSFADRYDRGLNDLRQRFWYVNVGVKF